MRRKKIFYKMLTYCCMITMTLIAVIPSPVIAWGQPDTAADMNDKANSATPSDAVSGSLKGRSEIIEFDSEEDTDSNIIINMPIDFSFNIDLFNVKEKGQIYSNNYLFENYSDMDINVTISQIYYEFTRPEEYQALSNLEELDKTSEMKQVYLYLRPTDPAEDDKDAADDADASDKPDDRIVITDVPQENVYTFDLSADPDAPDHAAYFAMGGEVNDQSEYKWRSGEIKLHVSFNFEPILEEEEEILEEIPEELPDETVKEVPTELPTDGSTDAPTDSPTDAPTEGTSDSPADTPTDGTNESPSDAPTDGTTDSPADTPTEGTNDSPADTPSEGTNEPPVDAPTEGTNEPPADTPTEGTNEPSVDAPTEETNDSPADTSTEGTNKPSVDAPTGGTNEPPVDAPTEGTNGSPADTPAEGTNDSPVDTSVKPLDNDDNVEDNITDTTGNEEYAESETASGDLNEEAYGATKSNSSSVEMDSDKEENFVPESSNKSTPIDSHKMDNILKTGTEPYVFCQ